MAGISLTNTATLFCQLHHAAQILADNIKLQVHYATNLKRMEVGMLIGIWDNGNLESIFSRITDRQTNSIHCNRTFVNSKISSFCHFRIECILECKIPAALCVIYSYTSSSLIYMSLNDMPCLLYTSPSPRD